MKSHIITAPKRNKRAAASNEKPPVEDERGWSGQHGQHPISEEEKKYRPARENPKKRA